MAASDLRKRVLEYVQEADVPLLQLMEFLVKSYKKMLFTNRPCLKNKGKSPMNAGKLI